MQRRRADAAVPRTGRRVGLRRRLADAVFAGAPTAAAPTTLRSCVARMRRVIERDRSDAVIVTRAPGYVLRAPQESFDVARFEGALADGRTHLSRNDPHAATIALRGGLSLWAGDPTPSSDTRTGCDRRPSG